MKEYSILNMGIIGYALFKPSVGNVWGLFIEFEIIHGSRLSAVSLSYEDSDWSRFRFYKVSQYGYICYKLPNSLSLCSVCYHEPKKKKEKQKYQWMKKVLHKIWCFIITACVLIILVTNPWCTSLQDPQSYLIFTSQLNCQNLMIVRYEIEFRI